MPRMIDCPNCTDLNGSKGVLVKTSGRLFIVLNGFLQRSIGIRIPTSLIEYLKERMPVSKRVAIKDCKLCNNQRKIEDPTDDSDRQAEAASIAQGEIPNIEKNEALYGSCGNVYRIYQGSVVEEYGIGMNDLPSYRVDPCAGGRCWGIGDGETTDTDKAGLQLPRGAQANQVVGLNPPATPGGSYTIKCSNRFNIVTGAQGVDISTGGPINLNGGITQIISPELTIGGETGRTSINGEVINMNAKSVEVAPTDGHFFVRGNISTPTNVIAGGHGHFESASVVKLMTTGRNESTKVSAPTNIYGGPAFWGGPAVEGIIASGREVASAALMLLSHPEQLLKMGGITLRYGLSIGESVTNLAYTLRPVELLPTGITFTLGFIPGLVWNWPHVHALPDGQHVHEMRVPDIDYSSDSAKELKKQITGVAQNAPLPRRNTNALQVLLDTTVFVISLPFKAAAAVLQHFTFIK